jgi:hypothetical protein
VAKYFSDRREGATAFSDTLSWRPARSTGVGAGRPLTARGPHGAAPGRHLPRWSGAPLGGRSEDDFADLFAIRSNPCVSRSGHDQDPVDTAPRRAHRLIAMQDRSANTNGQEAERANVTHCAECDCSSGLGWRGWRAYRVDDPELAEPPALAFYCPSCAEREFG